MIAVGVGKAAAAGEKKGTGAMSRRVCVTGLGG